MDSNSMQERGDGGQQRRGFFRRGGGEDRNRDTPIDARVEAKRSIPELKLTQAVISPEPILGVSEENRPDAIVLPRHEYTMIFNISDSGRIVCLDGKGLSLGNISTRGFRDNVDYSAENGDGFFLIRRSWGDLWTGVLTKNDQGIELAPRNWKVISNESKSEDVPDNIRELLKERHQAILRMGENNAFIGIQTENGYDAYLQRNRLSIKRSNGNEVFTDNLPGAFNLCEDPKAHGVIYYCQGETPRNIFRLDTRIDSGRWQQEVVEIPGEYPHIRNLKLDPGGSFFMFDSDGDFVILSKDSMQEVKRIPKFYNATLDDQGRIRGIDAQGHLVIYDANFQEVAQEAEKRRVAGLAQGLAADLFKKEEAGPSARVDTDQFQHLLPAKTNFEVQFSTQLQSTNSLEDISNVTQALSRLKSRLAGEGLRPDQIEFITEGIAKSITDRERVLAAPVINEGLTNLNTKLASGDLTLALVNEARDDLRKLNSLEGLADEGTRAQIRTLENRFNQQSTEFFRRESAVIEKEVNDLIAGTRVELEAMTSMPDFADWQEFKLPHRIGGLGALAHDYNEMPEMQGKILAARRQLQELSRDYETRFKDQYAQVREKASELMAERTGLLKVDVDSFLNRLRDRGFKERGQAETYLNTSESLDLLRTEIEEMKRQNPVTSRELDKYLKVQISNIISDIERGSLTSIAETGQQMELFGKTLFPKWEAKTKEKAQKKVDLIFIADERSKGPGVSPDKVYGDVGLAVINSRGKVERIRLYEGWEKEDTVRYGIEPLIPPSYVNYGEFGKIRKDYNDWKLGENSEIKKSLDEKSQAVREVRKRLREAKGKGQEEETFRKEYKKILDDYLSLYREKHISILHRVDRVKKAPETEYENGKGFPEEWKDYWVRDKTTEEHLEKMAQIFDMQLHQQSGILTIRGKPGAGKDVLVSMFSNRTKRPYFATDCTTWDTAYEFSEDIVLESKDGASQTVHVASTVLNGITTPGGIVYLNEIHALKEPAQIFLHALTDAKRRITLKTSSGKVVKALPDVILVASMNPSEKDNIEPALRDRMVFMDVDYPPLYREKDAGDANPNAPYDASEALRIARDVDSLSDLTLDSNMNRNEFVKMWDKYINGIVNDGAEPSAVQRFDIDVILGVVQFANKLRESFVARTSRRTQTASKALPVNLPATGRPLRDCAFNLSKMTDEQKATADPEATAKKLLEDWFLSKIDNLEDRATIKTAMATWTSSKRPAA